MRSVGALALLPLIETRIGLAVAELAVVDGVEVGRGSSSTFPDGALGSARFLFELLAGRGISLERGQWISTGAVTGVHEASPGQTVEARFGGRYRLSCQFVEALPERD